MTRAAVAVLAALWFAPALAQHNHALGHNEYHGWATEKIGNCCDNRDCGALRDDEIRATSIGIEVKIAGQWCPVLRQHYIIRGKSPDWSVAHACVGNTEHYLNLPPCERLLCFAGKGGF